MPSAPLGAQCRLVVYFVRSTLGVGIWRSRTRLPVSTCSSNRVGGVTIEEMPPSPAAVTTTPLGRVDPNVTRVAGSVHVSGHAGGKHGSPSVVGRDDSAKETTESSAASDDDLDLGLDLGRAAGRQRESPMKTPTAFVASGEKDWSGGGGSAVSAARRRMIADRARRILEGDDSD